MGKKGLDNLKKVLTYQDQFVAKAVYEQQLLDEVSDLRHEVCGLKKDNKNLKKTLVLTKERQGKLDADPLEQAIQKLKIERDRLKEDNALIHENIQSLEKGLDHRKCTIQEHKEMKALKDETKLLNKQHMALKQENDALQKKILKCEIEQRENEKIRQETEKLRAKVREMKREVIIRKTNCRACCSASTIGKVGHFEHFVLKETLKDLEAEMKLLPDEKNKLLQVKKEIAQDRYGICHLYERIQEEQLKIADSRATKAELKHCQREETALYGHLKNLNKELSKFREQRLKQEALECKIQVAGENIDHLKSRRQALLQQVEQLHSSMKTKEALKAGTI